MAPQGALIPASVAPVAHRLAALQHPVCEEGHYLFARPFARGAFAGVSYAVDMRDVEIQLVAKVLWKDGQDALKTGEPTFLPTSQERMDKELAALATLRGPLRLVDAISTPDHTTVLMTRVPGQFRRAWSKLKRLPLPARRTILRSALASVAEDLERLHARGFLHLDLKIDNLLVSHQGTTCLTDFGRAEPFSSEAKAQTSGGSPHVMAPEVATREPCDGRADVWSLFMAWAEAVVPDNDYFRRQAKRADALRDALETRRRAQLDVEWASAGRKPKDAPSDALREAHLNYQLVKMVTTSIVRDTTPYQVLGTWQSQHPGVLQPERLALEAQEDGISALFSALHDFDPELTALGLRDVLHRDPAQRICMAEFRTCLRQLQPETSVEELGARRRLASTLRAETEARRTYGLLRGRVRDLKHEAKKSEHADGGHMAR